MKLKEEEDGSLYIKQKQYIYKTTQDKQNNI